MTRALRLVLTVAAAIAVFFFTFWMGGVLLSLGGAPAWLIVVIAPAAAVAAGRFVWRGSADAGLLRSVVMGAIVVGTVGFIGGFFGPLIVAPGANQGPLLGLFITGPLGAILGGIGGGLRWVLRHGAEARAARRARAHPSESVGRDATTAVLAVHAQWVAFERDGSPLRVLELCREDVVWRPPGVAPIEGRAAVRTWLQAQPSVTIVRLDLADLRVDVSGNVAVKQARFTTELRGAGEAGTRRLSGSHAWTLRRHDADGPWLVADVQWTLDPGPLDAGHAAPAP